MKQNLFSLLILLSFFCCKDLYSQVTVGSLNDPERGALLEIKENTITAPSASDVTSLANATKGLLFPKVMLVANNSLIPLYQGADATAVEQLNATGMVVYNVNPDATNLTEGLFVWNGSEWLPLQGGINGGAQYTIANCEDVSIYGNYTPDVSLSTENYIQIRFNVSKAGAYKIYITPENDNGYYFYTTGEFFTTGTILVNVPAFGTPTAIQDDVLQFTLNEVVYDLPDNCSKVISVKQIEPAYTVDCSTVSVRGVYTQEVPTISNDNYILVTITVPESSVGAEYMIQTEYVNGYRFIGRGVLTEGVSTVTLSAEGTPLVSQNDNFTITSNSTIDNTNCSISVAVLGRQIRVASFGTYSYNLGNGGSIGNQNKLAFNTALFGTPTSLYPGLQDELYVTTGKTTSDNTPTAWRLKNSTQLKDHINNNQPDIIFTQYDWLEGPTEADYRIMLNYLNQYVEQGGVLVACADYFPIQNQILDTIYGTNIQIFSIGDGPTMMPFNRSSTSSILKTPYDLIPSTGTYGMQRDAGGNLDIGVIDDMEVLVFINETSTPQRARAVVHKTKPFLFIGDGGAFSGKLPSTEVANYPVKIDSFYMPFMPTTGENANSMSAHFFCNILVWAIEQAKLNTPGSFNIQ